MTIEMLLSCCSCGDCTVETDSLDGVLVDLNDVRKCVAFLTDSGFDAPCNIEHPLAWMLSVLWHCGATNEQKC